MFRALFHGGRQLNATDWAVRGAIALIFLLIGTGKFTDEHWVSLFREIGLGQWLRYVTGTIQVTGALLILLPGTARAGVVLLACSMIGAILAHAFFLRTGISGAPIPALFLVLISAGWPVRGAKKEQPSLRLQ